MFDANTDVKCEHYNLLPWNPFFANAHVDVTCEQGLDFTFIEKKLKCSFFRCNFVRFKEIFLLKFVRGKIWHIFYFSGHSCCYCLCSLQFHTRSCYAHQKYTLLQKKSATFSLHLRSYCSTYTRNSIRYLEITRRFAKITCNLIQWISLRKLLLVSGCSL